MNSYQTNAIVLRREDAFEADRIYNLYTEKFGRVRALASSVRKINAKLTGHLEPFNFIWVELMAKKGGDLFITTALSHGRFISNTSSNQITLFAKMANFALMMLKEPQKDEILWNFILESFLKAGSVEIGGIDKFLSDFKSGFIEIMGFGDNLGEAGYYLNDFDVL